MGVTDTAERVMISWTDALKREPLSLALVLMNLALLAFCYVILTAVANQRKEEITLLYNDKKEVRELLAKCVVPPQQRTGLSLPEYKLDLIQGTK